MLIIPAIDLRNGQCVRLAQGRKESATVYTGDPIETALMFEEQGARMLHVVDLDGAFAENNVRNRKVLGELVAAVRIPIQFGGGVRNVRDAEEVRGLGVARIVVGTIAIESPETLKEILDKSGSESVAVGIDARDGKVVTRGWETQANVSALDLARQVALLGVQRIVYTDVHRDGMLSGVNFEQTRLIAEASGVKVTASGGVSSLDDFRRVASVSQYGVDSVIVGKAFYEGRFTFEQAQLAV
jgi:phosphoribosylformimino-5-aminoimidazole carboxamide ribotide isomerase